MDAQPQIAAGEEIPETIPTDAAASIESGQEIPDNIPSDSMQQSPQIEPGQEIPDSIPTDERQSSLGEKALATAEGFGQGMLGPAEAAVSTMGQYLPEASGFPAAQRKFKLMPEDIKERAENNPELNVLGQAAGLATGALTGTGAIGLAEKASLQAAKAAELGKIGSGVISGMVSNGLIQAGDEASKWLLGQGDPIHPVGAAIARIGANGLFGGILKGTTQGLSKGLEVFNDNKVMGKYIGFLSGLGGAVKGAEETGDLFSSYDKSYGNMQKAYESGKNFYEKVMSNPALISHGAGLAGFVHGYEEGGVSEGLKDALLGELSVRGAGVAKNALSNYILPTIVKSLESNSVSNLAQKIQYAVNVGAGDQALSKAVDGLYKVMASPTIKAVSDMESRAKKRNQLDEYISNGGIDQDIQEERHQETKGYAEGGDVQVKPSLLHDDGVANQYPAQNMLLNSAKGRISSYLNNLKPRPVQPVGFFDPPDLSQQTKTYEKALDLANNPMSILHSIHQGTIEPDDVKHFNAMFPETSQLIQKKMTERMIDGNLTGEKPPYHIRQGMSLFMGADLSGDLSPQTIQAAQAAFLKSQPQQGGQQGNKSSLNKLSVNHMTANQAREQRAQSDKV